MPTKVSLANWKPSFNRLSDRVKSDESKILDQLQWWLQANFQNHRETTLKQERQPESTNPEREDLML